MDNENYAIDVFNRHVKYAGIYDNLKGLHILELGPGDNLSTGLISHAHGASCTLVDVDNFANFTEKNYKNLQNKLNSDLGVNLNLNFTNEESFLDKINCCYHTEGMVSLKKIGNNSIDFIFSQAVLEHVKKADFRETVYETKRILKPDSFSSHRVDFKDHLGGNLNNLRFSEELWEGNLFSSSGFYTNRLRLNEILGVFRSEGFEIITIDKNNWDFLPIERHKIHRSIKYENLDELKTSSFNILVKSN